MATRPPPAPPPDAPAADRPPLPPPDMAVTGWGDPRRRTGLPPGAARWLAAEVGPSSAPGTPVDPATVELPAPRLPGPAHAALRDAVGGGHVADDHEARLRHAGGKSYLDLVRMRRGTLETAPDAVVTPGTHQEVLEVLRVCAAHDVAVVPFGGGTSVVGGVAGLGGRHAAVISLDTRRLRDIVRIDPESLTATVGPGLRGPELEAVLGRQDLTLGHFPQSFEYATLGGYAATRSAGQASTGYGRFEELVAGVRLATPTGTLELGVGPASAAGPDLRALVVGSEGVFGVITEMTLRLRPAPSWVRDDGWAFPTLDQGMGALRRLAQAHLAPDVARLSDADESRATLALAGGSGARALRTFLRVRGQRNPCLLIAGWEGERALTTGRRAAAARILAAAGGVRLSRRIGRSWRNHRFQGPYLRDDLLDHGYLVETVETATSWSRLPALRDAVRTSFHDELGGDGRAPLVMSHLSHLYPDGVSLYVTVIAPADPAAPEEQWLRAKRRVTDAILDADGTLTHHHAVGADHRPWLAREIGPLGVDVLRAVKRTLDPEGILNPGKLIPEQ